MKCPKCESENNDSAKFCKKCGIHLTANNENNIGEVNNSYDTVKIIIVALIIIAVVLAGALIYINGFNNAQSENSQNFSNDNQSVENVNNAQQTQSQNIVSNSDSESSMTIYGGTFETGSGLSDKTYASIYVGSEHSGEKVMIQILYSRDGNTLNNGNMVSKTVDSLGYINVNSADAYKYYPDFATINLYDTSGNLLDTQSVSLTPTSGTQSF